MENNNIKEIWDKGKNQVNTYSLNEIKNFRYKKSSSIFRSVRNSVWLNYILKIIFIIALLLLSILNSKQTNILYVNILLTTVCAGLIIFDLRILKSINTIEFADEDLKNKLNSLNKFFNINYSVYRIISPLISPLLILIGSFYYHFFKYSVIEFANAEDLIVLTVILLIGYIIGIIGNYFGSSFLIKETVNIINLNDEEGILQTEIINKIKKRKIIWIAITSLIAMSGIILFYFIIRMI
jgi:hypothetical protein